MYIERNILHMLYKYCVGFELDPYRPWLLNKAFRLVENLFIQGFLFIHPRGVLIVQGSLLVVQ